MYTQNEYVSIQLNRDSYTSAYQEAEKIRLLRRAGIAEIRLTDVFCCAAGRLGHALVSIGKKLEQLERSASIAAAARMASIENV